MGRTLFEKMWDSHVVVPGEGDPDLLYVDLHLVHEVTSPQAFEGLRLHGPPGPPARPDVRRRWTTTCRPATHAGRPARREQQIEALAQNCAEFGVPLDGPAAAARGSCTSSAPSSGSRSPA